MLLQTWPWELEEAAHESRFPGGEEVGARPRFPALRPMAGTVWNDLHIHETLKPVFRNMDHFPNLTPNKSHLLLLLF